VFSKSLLTKLAHAESVAVLTGAGISAESGVPTFRSNDGLWNKFKPEELANFEAFSRNPELVWEWYMQRKRAMEEVAPNPGHYALVDMEKRFREFAIITQNIDNLHRRAGSTRIFELHGNIERNYCLGCGRNYSNADLFAMTNVPRCTVCRGMIRPDVVWFGEMLPVEEWNESVTASERADVFFSIGTSAVVYPAASLVTIARRSGAYVVEINAEPTDLSHTVDELLLGRSGEILPKLVELIKNHEPDQYTHGPAEPPLR
jgi:NAD-dependent deacetylase